MSKLAVVVLVFISIIASCLASVQPAKASGDYWTARTPLPEALAGCKAAVVNDKIYVFGKSVNYEYDPNTNSWDSNTLMPTPRSSFAVAALEGKIYVIGGSTGWSSDLGDVMTGKNEVYDPATDTWETKATMPIPSELCEANTASDLIYVMGGLKDPLRGDASNINQAYDPANDAWSLKTSMPTAVFKYASAVIDNKIYLMGGEGRDTPGNLNQIYDTETDSWSSGKNLPGPTNGAGAAATTGSMAAKRIYVIGGRQGYTYDVSKVNQIYDPAQDNWASGANMQTARQGLAVAVVDDQVYAFGGSFPEFQGSSTGTQTSSQLTITMMSNAKVTPLNFIPYEDSAANERYTPSGYGEIQPSVSPSPTLTFTPSPSLSPSLTPTSSPSSTPIPSPESPTTSPSGTSQPTSLPTSLSQQTPTITPPESGSDPFQSLTPGWLALIAAMVVGIPLSVMLIKRTSKKREG